MRAWVCACVLFTLASGVASAKDLALPKKNPAITLSIPDAWKPDYVDDEIQSQSPGSDVALNVAVSARDDFAAVVKDSKEYLRGHKVNLSVKPTEQTIDFAGTPGRVQRYRTTDENGKTVVDLITLEASRDRRVLITVWGSETERRNREDQLTAIMKSVRVPADTGEPGSFWSGGKSDGKSDGKPAAAPARGAAQSPTTAPAAAPYVVKRATFVTRKAAEYGDAAAHDAMFKVDEPILTYLEVAGETLTRLGPGKRRFGIVVDVAVTMRDGSVILDRKGMLTREFTFTLDDREPEFFLNLSVDLTGMPPQPGYVMTYTLHDQESGRTASVALPFGVVPAAAGTTEAKPEIKTEAKTEAGPDAAPTPSQARMTAYLWGLLIRDKLAQCDLATTGKQRAGLDAKIAAMQAEMAPYEAALRAEIKGKLEGCPTPEKAAAFQGMLTTYLEKSPEAFAEVLAQP